MNHRGTELGRKRSERGFCSQLKIFAGFKLLVSTKVVNIPTFFSLFFSCQVFSSTALAQSQPIYSAEDIFHPVVAYKGMIASQEALATQAGLAVLQEGGNAVDAAVTIGFTLAVTLPRAGNLGGGGFMLVHTAENRETITIDYREKAPLAATPDMFLDARGEVDVMKSRFSHLAVGVPGTVAGLTLALEKYGTISLARALQPAINLAANGFPVSEDLRNSLLFAQEQMAGSAASQRIFFREDGSPYGVGEIFVQTDLANSLRLIAQQGKAAFYQGEIAEAIATYMQAQGGLITQADLAKYQPVIRPPLQGNYRGYEVYSMPPPSSGGIHLIQLLNILEGFPLRRWGHNTAQTIHTMAESMKLAYADRSQFLGDTDFVSVPIAGLISKSYGGSLRSRLNLNTATPSNQIRPGNPQQWDESPETTHFSVVDKYGNAVANTYSLNFSYGTGITVPGTGILLNNQMDDFTAKPGVANAFGLIGGELNAIAPEKRMLSSMTPTMVMQDGKPFLITGSPGGSRIITATLQLILNVIDHQMNLAEATNAVRIHHQWLPDELRVEEGLNGDTINLLRRMGHEVVKKSAMGSTQSVMIKDEVFYGASDPRRPGALTSGY